MEKKTRPDWGALFEQALTEPGRLGEYYSLFHQYSLGNQMIAVREIISRGLPVGPIASFRRWNELGRRIKKGQRAIALWMPVTVKRKVKQEDGTEGEEIQRFFIMKNNWFTLAQTEPIGPENPGTVPTPEIPEWNREQALANLGITEVPFEHPDGNCQGFARPNKMQIAINPLARFPWKTTFHEIAHCLLHNRQEEAAVFVDGGVLDTATCEAEAESVAYLCCATLGLPGLEEARGYVQSWLGSSAKAEEFVKKSAARVFAAADKILKAGQSYCKEAAHEDDPEREEVRHGV